ncbi:MAG: hypothetical protein KatS3mg050_0386 [Litorilinea sp.]|nr:MAG: hypothetical protein KatS3mg050_0386 [Litorilinea sp.]
MDISAIIQTWIKVLTQPGEAVFQEEKARPNATLLTAIIWVLVAAVIAGVLNLIRGMIFVTSSGGFEMMLRQMDLPPEVIQQFNMIMSPGMMTGLMGAQTIASIILSPIFFLIGVGILHLVASLLGGQGDFGRYAYLNATFQAPITIASAILGFVPFLGGCLSFLLAIYGIVLAYFATKVNYGLTSGKALVVVLVPVILVFLVFICMFLGLAGLLLSTGGS